MKSAEHGPALTTHSGLSCVFGDPFIGAPLHVRHRSTSNEFLRLWKVGKMVCLQTAKQDRGAPAKGGLERALQPLRRSASRSRS